ncbi:hypothetical protein HPG69_010387 [Diceros bicornis minor]|uniref:Ig-like domain-containing protein n=1 Tax=Diceros bicornis minor TaxID=77932 RepID=A0A7J7F8E2_DICBM|nr:hypothetical protein HPG69_010387 [Diceros bicornis minor]
MFPPHGASVNGSSVDGKQSKLVPPTEAGSAHDKEMKSLALTSVTGCALLPSQPVDSCGANNMGNNPQRQAFLHQSLQKREKLDQKETRITWASRSDETLTLQIDPVDITHDEYYRCQVVTSYGNFLHGYHLQVLVPPEVTLFQSKNRTAVCRAVARKPAAQISWTPEGDCVTEQEYWDNGTVTIQSTCHWEDCHVPTASCTVSHVTGNKSLSLELNPGLRTLRFPASSLLIILYVRFALFLVILVITGCIYFQRFDGCKCPNLVTDSPNTDFKIK